MDPVIASALISFGGVVLSALFSFLISKHQTKAEIRKVNMNWEHEHERDFAKMCADVSVFVNSFTPKDQTSALASVSEMRAKESDDIADYLDNFYDAIMKHESRAKVQIALDNVISAYRKSNKEHSIDL